MKALRYILFSLLIVAALGLLAYYIFAEKDLSSSNIVKCLLLIASAVASMMKTGRRRKPANRKVVYQKAYGKFMQNAFQDEPKLEKKLLDAIDDYNQDKPSAAIAKLQKLRKECQRTDDIYAVTVFTALCYEDMHAWQDALVQYNAAVNMRNDTTLHSNLAHCLQNLGRYEEAEASYHRALQVDPKNSIAMNNLAGLLFRQGDYEGALDCAEDALEINAKLPQALSLAAICCALQGYEEEYTAYYRRAVAAGYDGSKIKATIKNLDPTL